MYVLRNMYKRRDFAVPAVRDARYLGGRQVMGVPFGPERARRVVAMRIAWASLRRFWTSASPMVVRRSAFQCLVRGAGFAGLAACVGLRGPLTRGDTRPLDSLQNAYL